MEAPDKIYIPRTNMEVENHLEEFWVDHKTFDSDIEYIRKDAFIEKACDFIKANIDHYIGHYLNDDDTYLDDTFIENFKKYMED